MSTGKTYSTKYLLDSNNNRGAAGQVLSTTSTGVDWVDANTVPGSGLWLANGNDIYNSNSGNVGIGVTNPQGILSLKNQIANSGTPLTYSTAQQNVLNGYYTTGESPNRYKRYFDIACVGDGDGTNGWGSIRFLTNPVADDTAVERMRVTSSASDNNAVVAIGVTPSNWYNDIVLQVGTASLQSVSNTTITLGCNWYTDSGILTDETYINDGSALAYQQNAGKHTWFTSPNGTAGDAVTFTQRMVILNDGNVGIGTDSPGSTLTLGNVTGNVAELRVLRSNALSTTYGFINTTGGTAQLGGSSDTRIIASTGRLLFNSNNTDQISLEANGEYRLKLGSTTTGYEASMDNSNTAYRIFGSRFGGTGKYVAIWSDGANENTRFYPTKTIFYKNVGIGVTGPGEKLTIGDTGNVGMSITDGTHTQYVASIATADAYGNGSTVGQLYLRGYDGIGFSGNQGGATHMTLLTGGNVGIGTTTPLAKLDIQGTQGQLFSVTDDLSGSIFAVSDISGVPIFDVNSSGLSTFNGDVTLPSGSVTVPSLRFGDSDTGIWSSTGNAINISTGAVNRFSVSANGISVTTVVANTTAASLFLVLGPGGSRFESRTAAQVLSDIGAAPAAGGAYLPLAGNLTSTPITGSVFFDRTITSQTQMRLFCDGAAQSGIVCDKGDLLFRVTGTSSNDIRFFGKIDGTATDEFYRIDSGTERNEFMHDVVIGERVGLNMTSTTGKLVVSSGAGANGDCIVVIEADTDNTVENSNPVLKLQQDGGGAFTHFGMNGNPDFTYTGSNTNAGYSRAATDFQIVAGSTTLAATFLSNGNVGIGTNAPSDLLTIQGAAKNISINNTTEDDAGIVFRDAQGATDQAAAIKFNSSDNKLKFFVNDEVAQRMVIDTSGNVGINKTSPAVKLDVSDSIAGAGFTGGLARFENTIETNSGGAGVLNIANNYQGGFGTLIKFFFEESSVATINFNSSTNAVVYNTTSDYRLKEDLQQFNGLEIVDQIKTYNYKWKKADARGYGALAHELQEVFPDAVTGEKDGEDMQGVDYSTLVPVLIKSIQELKAEIELLKQNK